MSAAVDERRRARPVGQGEDVVWWPGWVLDGDVRLSPGDDAAWARRRAGNGTIAAGAVLAFRRRGEVAGMLRAEDDGALARLAGGLTARLLRFVEAAEGRDDAALAEAGGEALAAIDALDQMLGEAEAAVVFHVGLRGVFCGAARARARAALGLPAIEDGSLPGLPQSSAMSHAAGRV